MDVKTKIKVKNLDLMIELLDQAKYHAYNLERHLQHLNELSMEVEIEQSDGICSEYKEQENN